MRFKSNRKGDSQENFLSQNNVEILDDLCRPSESWNKNRKDQMN